MVQAVGCLVGWVPCESPTHAYLSGYPGGIRFLHGCALIIYCGINISSVRYSYLSTAVSNKINSIPQESGIWGPLGVRVTAHVDDTALSKEIETYSYLYTPAEARYMGTLRVLVLIHILPDSGLMEIPEVQCNVYKAVLVLPHRSK